MSSRIDQLRQRLKAVAGDARAIVERAEADGRDLDVTEQLDVKAKLSEAKELKREITRREADDRAKKMLDALGADVPGRFTPGMPPGMTPPPPTGGQFGFSGYNAPGRSDWSKAVAGQVTASARTSGVKALTSASIDIPTPVPTTIVGLPQTSRRVLDLITNRQQLTGNTFEFIRQTARTNNASPVADGDVKPTSVFTTTPVEDKARVVAHLSEAFPERFLADYQALSTFLDTEMAEGVYQALEDEIMNGDGTGEHFTGILETSGTGAVAWSTDLFTTIRKARTAMEILGEIPTAWVMHPNDIERVDLTTDANGRLYLTGAGGDVRVDSLFGGLPRVPSVRMPAGTALLGDWNQAMLLVRQDVQLRFGQPGDLFTRNEVQARAEGRFGFAVLRPQAFATVDLTP